MINANNLIFKILLVVAWLIFVGVSIEAGGLIVNFIVSLVNPSFVSNLYQKLDLTYIYKDSPLPFFGVYSFILVLAILKCVLFYIVVRMMHKMDLSKPFDTYVSRQTSLVSYYALSIGFLSYMAKEVTRNLAHYGYDMASLNHFWGDSEAYVFMGAVVYIIATIFKKGVELQSENELTV